MEEVSDHVVQRVREARRARHLSAAALAKVCAEAGFPQLTASVIANIESGRRDNQGRRRRAVTVDEVVAFSQALNVSVAALLPPESNGGGTSELDWVQHHDIQAIRRGIREAQRRDGVPASQQLR